MPTRALRVGCRDGASQTEQLEGPRHVGAVDFAWAGSTDGDQTVLGVGPLAGTNVPGASGLVLAGRSPLWDGFHVTSLSGAGTTLAGIGIDLVALEGKAPEPSMLLIQGRRGATRVVVSPLDPEHLWQGTHDGDGVHALLGHLLQRHQDDAPRVQVMACGPAAARTSFGCLCVAGVERGACHPVHGWVSRGGYGSRLFQAHHLCAMVITGDDVAAGTRRGTEGSGLDRFSPDMTARELEAAVNIDFNPRLKSWGALGARLSAVRQRLLWFNSSSIYLDHEQRDALYHRGLRDHYLARLIDEIGGRGTRHTCGEPCALACKRVVSGQLKEEDSHVALGPQLGVLDPGAADEIVSHCRMLGFDCLSAGAAIAWLMERLHLGLLEPGFLGARAQPRWSPVDFDPVEDSLHNARLGRDLAEAILFAPWAAPLRGGLRAGSLAAGGASSPLAVYIANGERGEAPCAPYWAPGFYTPMPISGEHHPYYGIDFVPPRVLGRKSAQRMTAELMLQNSGVCRLHRGWAESLLSELVGRPAGGGADWAAHHRQLARQIFRGRRARFWETARVVDIIATFLRDYQFDAAPDAELDRWVRRFREDRASAARAYWSEINAGLEEVLGS